MVMFLLNMGKNKLEQQAIMDFGVANCQNRSWSSPLFSSLIAPSIAQAKQFSSKELHYYGTMKKMNIVSSRIKKLL